jgi:pSer/pThr/pTyr-binding forkhead associated (FHA) protein
MDDQGQGLLTYAAAVPAPLTFLLRAGNGEETIHEVASSYAIIGRGEGCDIRLEEPTVSYRHAYVQAIGSCVACIDLMSATGIEWSGPPFSGWLTPQHTMLVGTTTIELQGEAWTWDDGLKPPLEFRPRDEQRPEYGVLPNVELELLNTPHKGTKWPINRVITLVGRDERCRITIVDERISRVQCALLLLPSGLWVIDLLGKGGIQVGGQTCRCALLTIGMEMTIGQYQLVAHYPQIAANQMQAHPFSQGDGADFLVRPNKIFQAEFYHDTLIIVPIGDSESFFFQDIHIEASRICDLITQRGFNHVVIDFSRLSRIGHLYIEGLMAICRTSPGRAALCGANSTTYETLQIMPLGRLYHHYATRQEALQAVYLST